MRYVPLHTLGAILKWQHPPTGQRMLSFKNSAQSMEQNCMYGTFLKQRRSVWEEQICDGCFSHFGRLFGVVHLVIHLGSPWTRGPCFSSWNVARTVVSNINLIRGTLLCKLCMPSLTLVPTLDDCRSVAAQVHCDTMVVAVSPMETLPPASNDVSKLSLSL